MTALPPEADIRLVLAFMTAYDPKRTSQSKYCASANQNRNGQFEHFKTSGYERDRKFYSDRRDIDLFDR